jgi:ADP-ribosylglycohydrolase
MRISPLGIFCWNSDLEKTSQLAQLDASLTHPHPICGQANALFAMAIAQLISSRKSPQETYEDITVWATETKVEKTLMKAILDAPGSVPSDYVSLQGWVIIAFQNALWQLLNAPSLEEGVVDTVMRGGDTDTNAAIAGAMLGAAYGRNALPNQWIEKLLSCHPKAGEPRVRRPRPECFWPVNALELARSLVTGGSL